jgi:hypothetical protein
VIIRQYIPRKPHATGIKYWALVDQFGYIYLFEIYEGSKTASNENTSSILSGLAFIVVYRFNLQIPKGNYLKKKFNLLGAYKFVMDNFFGSWKIAQLLQAAGLKLS